MKPIRVALIDDSAICRGQLREILEQARDIQVVEALSSGRTVLEVLSRKRPDVLVTDLLMPDMDGLDVVREVMRHAPLPILIVSASGFPDGKTFEAVRLGALEVARKPDFGAQREEAAVRDAVRRIAHVPVVRHPGLHAATVAPPASSPLPIFGGRGLRVVGVGASAGGPVAMAQLLEGLSVPGAPAVLVAQHMPPRHVDDFAAFLARRCRLTVRVCREATPVQEGHVFVPMDGHDLVMVGPGEVGVAASVDPLIPSVDRLLSSIAHWAAPRAAGVVLSGIGSDGRVGLERLRKRGGYTLVQDEQSSTVYGMPKAAAPFADEALPPLELAHALLRKARLGQWTPAPGVAR